MKREREEKWVGKKRTAPIMAHHDSLAPFLYQFFSSCLPLYEYVIVE